MSNNARIEILPPRTGMRVTIRRDQSKTSRPINATMDAIRFREEKFQTASVKG